jgi:catalase
VPQPPRRASRNGSKADGTGNRNVDAARRDHAGTGLTTEQGIPVSDDQNSLRAGARGPGLLEDFVLREKLTHFDHERIPERVVHARGSGAHGVFQVYEPLTDLTTAAFLQDPAARTPVFVRFSTVVGFRGSTDTPRDVRGFATKFYTPDGNFDLVGNNMPVFFIQDAIKFPDLVHAVKPEPHHEMPQASAAHDTFWDFISLTPESMHMIMWVLSDRALPRSYAMMEGFGVHTFRLINAEGRARLVKFHWKPVLGVHSLVWDEAQKISGKDPDFNRRDLWESIERGNYPEFELGIQVMEEADQDQFEFDVRDSSKIWPEELIPVRKVGRMTLNRNPENFFAETEQVAFHVGNLVPGIDITDDPLLHGRLFSYLDTQLLRLAGPNFTQLPINRPLAEVHTNQREGFHQHRVDRGRVAYGPNSLAAGAPMQAGPGRGYTSYPRQVEGPVVRERSESFSDHYSQATLFWRSMSGAEKQHIIEAFLFELGKVETVAIRERMVDLLTQVDVGLAAIVAEGIGVTPPATTDAEGARRQADARLRQAWETFGVTGMPGPRRESRVERSPALSMENTVKGNPKGRKVAILAADGVDGAAIIALRRALLDAGVVAEVIAPKLGPLQGAGRGQVAADHSFTTMASVVYDATFVPGGRAAVETLCNNGSAVHWVAESYKHGKPVAAAGEGVELLWKAGIKEDTARIEAGVLLLNGGRDLGDGAARFLEAIGQHRFFARAIKPVPA